MFILDHGIVSLHPTATVYYVPWICQPLSHSNCLFWTMELSATTPQELVIIALWKGKQGWRLVQRAVCQGPKKMRTTTGIESFCCMWKNDFDQDDANYNLKKVMSFDVIQSRFRKKKHPWCADQIYAYFRESDINIFVAVFWLHILRNHLDPPSTYRTLPDLPLQEFLLKRWLFQ